MTSCDAPAVTALVPWYGSNRTLAPTIVSELGPHRAYWEPFCGSMAVLLAKPPAASETANDLHGDLVNLARVLKDPCEGPRLYRRLRRTLCCQEFVAEARQRLRTDVSPPDRAYWFFLNSWLSMNGLAGSKAGMVNNWGIARRYTSGGGSPSVRWRSSVDSLPAFSRRLRNVLILSDDGLELCERIADEDGTVIYVDAPYIEKGAEYLHDFAPADHERLSRALGRFHKTRVVVSYYEHQKLANLYPPKRWTRVTCPTAKGLVRAARRGKGGRVLAPEVLLINGPSYSQSRDLFGTGGVAS